MLIANFTLIILIAYLLGSIPTGYWLGRLKGIDIRQQGSGNIGMTNVLRVLGKPAAILTLLVDIGKGAAAVTLIPMLFHTPEPWFKVLIGLAAVCGHNWTIFLKFKGGKGVATSAGVFLGLSWLSTLLVIAIFAVILALFRYVSLGSMVAAVCFPFLIYFDLLYRDKLQNEYIYIILAVLLAIFIIVRHCSNIKRLLAGTENKFSFKKKN
ncbi:MAG: glycerol-3-phosphate 1-O-acyltransferase PlsY [bacterium]|nr:glycerol-3-phosphate 1-O-acyltransferase PlsY [bacterium]